MSPIPLILCGKSSMMAESFSNALNSDEYEVIHCCHSFETASHEIPILLRGEPLPNPDSHLSTFNKASPSYQSTDSAQRIPRAIVLGKGFSSREVSSLQKACKSESEEQETVWLVPDDAKFSTMDKVKAIGTGGVMLPGLIAERVRRCLREGGLRPGNEGNVRGGEWGF